MIANELIFSHFSYFEDYYRLSYYRFSQKQILRQDWSTSSYLRDDPQNTGQGVGKWDREEKKNIQCDTQPFIVAINRSLILPQNPESHYSTHALELSHLKDIYLSTSVSHCFKIAPREHKLPDIISPKGFKTQRKPSGKDAGSHKSTDFGIWVRAPSLTVMIFNARSLPNLTSSGNSFKPAYPVSICTFLLPLSIFLLSGTRWTRLTLHFAFSRPEINHLSKELWFILEGKPQSDS